MHKESVACWMLCNYGIVGMHGRWSSSNYSQVQLHYAIFNVKTSHANLFPHGKQMCKFHLFLSILYFDQEWILVSNVIVGSDFYKCKMKIDLLSFCGSEKQIIRLSLQLKRHE